VPRVPALFIPPALEPFAAAWVVLVGAVVGSFLNVVIARVPAGLSVVHPPSRCPRCGRGIAWYDNVPIVSFLLLRGRCRGCRAPISWRYPLVEALVAAAAFLAYARHGVSVAAAAELVVVAILVALSFIDLDTWLLPYPLTLPLIALGLGASALGLSAAPSLASSALGAGLGFGAFALVSLVAEKVFKKEALGFGDVWLLAGLGAWLGAGALLPVILLASTQGALVGIALLLLGKGEPGRDAVAREGAPREAGTRAALEDDWVPPRHAVPFGPFLAAAALEWLYLSVPLAEAIPLFLPFV
jgi:leader peptidase (prepilin peptidase) / N-methyltransferase